MTRISWMKISSKRKQEYLAPSCYISSLKNTWQIWTCQDIKEPLFHGKEARIEDAELASKVYGWMDDISILHTVVLLPS